VGFAILVAAGCSKRAAPQPESAAFATPEEAVEALVAAAEKNDIAALKRLLGPGTDELLMSGDEVEDRTEREAFVARYREKHSFAAGGPDDVVLQVGNDDWPMPIPLVREQGRWSFDGDAGVHELLMRRIGANELRTIDVMRGYVQAQDEYAATSHDGVAAGAYAQKLRSDPGKHNGLYWDVATGEAQSPAGPMLADATAEGYGSGNAQTTPYHGYLYRMLLAQGPAAIGGVREYVVDGKLTDGFALIAWPAAYGASGIMTFMVNQDGVVWQRDLGEDTLQAAAAIAQFNPDETWTPIAPEAGDSADQPVARANPASEHCIAQGGRLSIEHGPNGGEYGVCMFEDNYQCEEWALLRGDCRMGGIRITGYVSDMARYCAITGGRFVDTSTDSSMQQGTCTFASGKGCDAAAYYRGDCQRG